MNQFIYPCAKWILPRKFAELTGMTEKQLEHRRYNGEWPEGVMWRIGPDHRVRFNIVEYDRWVESNPVN